MFEYPLVPETYCFAQLDGTLRDSPKLYVRTVLVNKEAHQGHNTGIDLLHSV